ncbi:MAG: cytochrome c oxidase accessory protein CcoG [Myxococcota bacterium]
MSTQTTTPTAPDVDAQRPHLPEAPDTMTKEEFSFVLQAPEEVLSTMHQDGRRRWMYPKQSKGRYLTARRMVGWTLIVLFLALPIIPIRGRPAIFLDIVHRKFALFGLSFFATDTLLLMTFGFITLASILLVTAMLGRVWCGWACPQTVYMEFLFRPVERFFEGKEAARKKRDAGPWTADKLWRKAGKYVVYTAIALVLAHTFVAYFVSWEQLLVWMRSSPSDQPGFFIMMAATTALIVFDFGYFREQMCIIACPYSRIQSVLMDRDSLIVSYDPNRGEHRGRRTRAQREQERAGVQLLHLGDCVDCGACVRTCPVGIDIRDGLQMECINCTQCIDACDAIMIGVGKEPGLIRYTSENALEGDPQRIFRPRVALYTAVMAIMSALFAFGVTRTQGLDIDVLRARGAPFIVLPTGDASNRLTVRVQNRTGADVRVRVEALEPEGVELKVIGPKTMELPPNKLARMDMWVVVPSAHFRTTNRIEGTFLIGDGGELDQEVDFVLLGPSEGPP